MEMSTQSEEVSVNEIKITPTSSQHEVITLKAKSEFEENVVLAYQSLKAKAGSNESVKDSKQSKGMNASLRYLKLAHEALVLHKEDKAPLNANVLDKLKRIASHGISYQILIGKIFIELLNRKEYILSLPSSLIIPFVNQVLHIAPMVKTTSIEFELEGLADEFVTELNNKDKLNEEQLTGLKQFIIGTPIKVKKASCNQIDFSSFTVMLTTINNHLRIIESSEAQYLLFIENMDKFVSIIQQASLKDTSSLESYTEFGSILLYLLHCNEVILLYPNEQEKNSANVLFYLDFADTGLSLHQCRCTLIENHSVTLLRRQLIALAMAYIKHFSALDQEFETLSICYILLKRLYALYPDQHKQYAELLVKVAFALSVFKEDPSEDCRQFINNIIDYPGIEEHLIELKTAFIQKNAELSNSKGVEFQVNAVKRDNPFGINGMSIIDYDTKVAFFNHKQVTAGEVFDLYIEANEAYSMIDFCFMIEDYDINVTFSYSLTSDIDCTFISFRQQEQFDEFESPMKVLLFITAPCIIKVSFDNSYSWFRSKGIKYKANVLKASNGFEILQKLALERLGVLISSEKSIDPAPSHLNKDAVFRFEHYTREIDMEILYGNIKAFERAVERKAINPTLPLLIKDNFIWEVNKEKERRELNKESLNEIISHAIADKDKLTIVDLVNMSHIDCTMTSEVEEVLRFTPDEVSNVLFVKGNYVYCAIYHLLFQASIENRVVNAVLYIHCSNAGILAGVYYNEAMTFVDKLNDMSGDNEGFIVKKAQIIRESIEMNIIEKTKAKEGEKEIFDIVLSGIEGQTAEFSAILSKEHWGEYIKTSITIKSKSFMETVLKVAPFFQFTE